MNKILVEVSVGELLDKLTILEIKKDKIKDVEKLKFISFDDAQTKFKKIDKNENHVTNSKYANRIRDIKNDKIKNSLLELTKLFKQR